MEKLLLTTPPKKNFVVHLNLPAFSLMSFSLLHWLWKMICAFTSPSLDHNSPPSDVGQPLLFAVAGTWSKMLPLSSQTAFLLNQLLCTCFQLILDVISFVFKPWNRLDPPLTRHDRGLQTRCSWFCRGPRESTEEIQVPHTRTSKNTDTHKKKPHSIFITNVGFYLWVFLFYCLCSWIALWSTSPVLNFRSNSSTTRTHIVSSSVLSFKICSAWAKKKNLSAHVTAYYCWWVFECRNSEVASKLGFLFLGPY